jgi:hypothetical protein
MKTVFSVLRSKGLKMKAAVSANNPAFADMAADINAAKADGVSNVTLAAGAVIAIAAIVLGIGVIRNLLAR